MTRDGDTSVPDLEAIRVRSVAAAAGSYDTAMKVARTDVPVLLAEVVRLTAQLEATRTETRTEWGVSQRKGVDPATPATDEEGARFGARQGWGTVMRRQVGPWTPPAPGGDGT